MFKVAILKMKESNRITYWVTLYNLNKYVPNNGFNEENGILTPYMSEVFENATAEAESWASFFGVSVEIYID